MVALTSLRTAGWISGGVQAVRLPVHRDQLPGSAPGPTLGNLLPR